MKFGRLLDILAPAVWGEPLGMQLSAYTCCVYDKFGL